MTPLIFTLFSAAKSLFSQPFQGFVSRAFFIDLQFSWYLHDVAIVLMIYVGRNCVFSGSHMWKNYTCFLFLTCTSLPTWWMLHESVHSMLDVTLKVSERSAKSMLDVTWRCSEPNAKSVLGVTWKWSQLRCWDNYKTKDLRPSINSMLDNYKTKELRRSINRV